jgi:hypothetical protein
MCFCPRPGDENLSRLLKRHLISVSLFDFLESYQLYFDINENNSAVAEA